MLTFFFLNFIKLFHFSLKKSFPDYYFRCHALQCADQTVDKHFWLQLSDLQQYETKSQELKQAHEHNPQLHRRLWKWLQYKQKVQNHWTSVLSHRAIGPPALSRHTGPAVQRIIVKCCFMKTGGDFKPLFKVGRLIFRSLLACCQASDNKAIELEPYLWLDSF